jgi:hypothetical protein
MVSNRKKLRIVTLLLPAIPFLISLTQDAITYQYQGVQKHSGISIFAMGSTAILGGGLLEWLTWLANPIALVAWINFLKESKPVNKMESIIRRSKPKSPWISLIAVAIALSFRFWKEILAAESGSTGRIYSFEAGYWLWICSITLLCICINLYHFLPKLMKRRT